MGIFMKAMGIFMTVTCLWSSALTIKLFSSNPSEFLKNIFDTTCIVKGDVSEIVKLN